MYEFGFRGNQVFKPKYDRNFFPISVGNRAYRKELAKHKSVETVIALKRGKGQTSVHRTEVFADMYEDDNCVYVERLLKTLLWIKGGHTVYFHGPEYIFDYLNSQYCPGGIRQFDAGYMERIFGKPFAIKLVGEDEIPRQDEKARPMGGNLDGCRIGFDAGGSDRKVSAVVDGKTVYSEEVVWHPKLSEDPQYQYDGIMDSLNRAASKMERVDAIGVSAAGIYIDNEVKAASLFIKIPDRLFESKVKRIFIDIARDMGGVPIEVANDGDVTALAGSMSLGENGILGIAMGTSEAGGYVNEKGLITGWLNELAFVPMDYSCNAMMDEWAGDIGCGVKYLSQDGVIKLAESGGITFNGDLSPAEKLRFVQKLMADDDERALRIYEGIGYYLGYAVAYYSEFYDINKVLILGRVTSGKGGDVIVDNANLVLKMEFPELFEKMSIGMPDEKARRVGQAIAAASLPKIN